MRETGHGGEGRRTRGGGGTNALQPASHQSKASRALHVAFLLVVLLWCVRQWVNT